MVLPLDEIKLKFSKKIKQWDLLEVSSVAYLGIGLSFVLLGLAVFAATEWVRLSTLYEPVACAATSYSFDSVNPILFEANFEISITCTNPNSYPIKLRPTKPGRAYGGPTLTNIGKVKLGSCDMPVSEDDNPGSDVIKAYVSAALIPIVSVVTVWPVAIYFELLTQAVVESSLMGIPLPMVLDIARNCVLKVILIDVPKIHDFICGPEKFKDLKPPPGELDLSIPFRLQAGKKAFDKLATLRDTVLGAILTFCALSSISLFCFCWPTPIFGRCLKWRRSANTTFVDKVGPENAVTSD